ncbi:MAG: DUF3524 domain-containing protein [Planctomycetes bacterium]|nr:DUF3524 domain-containing protein [Planctomycetota bacterium]MBL7107035.1 DUF3524 domain-containing protein [Phycisphaerae bacterium]
MKILAIEPYYGGSHKAFLDSLQKLSCHEWTILKMPAYKWKWRMRGSAISFASEVKELLGGGESWDVLFFSDMLNGAEFCGLCPQIASKAAKVMYFHENQLTYPVRFEDERDYQFVMTNMTSALCCNEVWFNSAFHRDSFLDSLEVFIKRMPDNQPVGEVGRIREKSFVYPQGIWPIGTDGQRRAGPLRILWAGRWEHDKRPEDFFEALKIIEDRVDFELSVIGESFRDEPEIFGWAKEHFCERIVNWGYQKNRADYEDVLRDSDIIVSTAGHEFFGVGVVEAVSAGCVPLLPERLAYPEVFGGNGDEFRSEFFYDGSVRGLADKLAAAAEKLANDELFPMGGCEKIVEKYYWPKLISRYDIGLERLAGLRQG